MSGNIKHVMFHGLEHGKQGKTRKSEDGMA